MEDLLIKRNSRPLFITILTLLFDNNSTEIVDDYITFVRPLLHPDCDYVLVTRNGTQYSKLSDLMSKLVFEAIGEYIHPTRYRQIVQTESVREFSPGEQDIIKNTALKSLKLTIRSYHPERLQRKPNIVLESCSVALQKRLPEIRHADTP